MSEGTVRSIATNAVLIVLLALSQIALSHQFPYQWQASTSLGQPPSSQTLSFATLGEFNGAARALSLYTQSFDAQAGKSLSLRRLDLAATHQWLARASELAPHSAYPTFLVSRIYASVADPGQARQMLDWVAGRYPLSPSSHWPWLAHAVYLARHELNDAHLARQYAYLLRTRARGSAIPDWARDLEFFLLKDLNEYDAARALLGGLIQSGQIRDQRALQVMLGDLERIKSNIPADQRSHESARNTDHTDNEMVDEGVDRSRNEFTNRKDWK